MTVTIQSGIAAWRFPSRETTGSGRCAGLPTASGASPAPGSQRGSDRFQLVRLCSFTQPEFPKAQPLASRERTDRDCCHSFGGSMRKPQTPAKEVWGYRLSLVKGVVSVRDGSLTLTIIPLSRGMFLPILHLVSFGARERLGRVGRLRLRHDVRPQPTVSRSSKLKNFAGRPSSSQNFIGAAVSNSFVLSEVYSVMRRVMPHSLPVRKSSIC